MSSRMEATAGCMRRAVSHEENCTSEEIRGVLSAMRSGIWELSRNSNSGPSRRNGETSKERATATSNLRSRRGSRQSQLRLRNQRGGRGKALTILQACLSAHVGRASGSLLGI